jgi:hypothetical protein
MNSIISVKQTARTAGILYLIMFFAGPLTLIFVSSKIIVPGDASATANNVLSFEGLFRGGIAGNLLVLFLDLGLSVLLYMLLKPVSKPLAMIAMAFRLVMVAMRGINLLNYFLALQLLHSDIYPNAFDTDQIQALTMLFLNGFGKGLSLDLIFFSLHLFLVGFLVFKSGFFPRILGILLIIASIGYFSDSFSGILLPAYREIISKIIIAPAVIGELSFTLWLLIKRVNVEKWIKRNEASVW